MIVTIHQPEHMPWIGFFNKIDKSDVLVYLDNVQFEKNNFQNRNRISNNGKITWITTPVKLKNHTLKDLSKIEIENSINWKKKYLRTIYYAYCKHPFFYDYFDDISYIINQENTFIMDLNIKLIEYFISLFGIKAMTVRASEIVPIYTGKLNLLNICKAVNADIYLSGPFGRNYLDVQSFEREKIKIIFNDIVHPKYEQYRQKNFISHLSIVDLLFNYGAEKSIEIIRNSEEKYFDKEDITKDL